MKCQEEQELHAQVKQVRGRLQGLAADLRVVDDEVEALAPQRMQHELLDQACGSLEKLGELGVFGATLTGYGVVYLLLREIPADGHIVLKESRIDYLSPVRGQLRAACRRPPPVAIEKFQAGFRRHGKARLDLMVQIAGSGRQAAVIFHGRFVAGR